MNIQKNTNDAVEYNIIQPKMDDIEERNEVEEIDKTEMNILCSTPPLHPLPPIHVPPIETSHSTCSLYLDSKTKNIILPTIIKRPKTCSVNIRNNLDNYSNHYDNIYENNHNKKKEKRCIV